MSHEDSNIGAHGYPWSSDASSNAAQGSQTGQYDQPYLEFEFDQVEQPNRPAAYDTRIHGMYGPETADALPTTQYSQVYGVHTLGGPSSQHPPKQHEPYESPFGRMKGDTIPDPSSVEAYGRTFQNYRGDKYFLPNDAAEQDRLDLGHKAWLIMLKNRYHLAPIGQPPRVLDIGTGTGIWAMEFAKKYPQSTVIGTDLSLIQPDHTSRPPNVDFIREDAEENWVWDELFDYVHLRLMVTCFNDHKEVIKKIFDNLKPGGWIEYQDADLHLDSDDRSLRGTALIKWALLTIAGGAARGRDMDVTRKLKDYLIEVGFVDVVEEKLKQWGNGWPEDPAAKTLGHIGLICTHEGIEATSMKLLHEGLGMTESDVSRLKTQAQKDAANEDIHFYWPIYVVYGRKPFDHEVATTQSRTIAIKAEQ
ncbi:S-adenosyl-L-methionine-dependent methyltransferase [Xylariales sp. AK1849]|nr:S-adenosyl-L-methionine-dependent methyltransferase [Xylariales sp. AK1849]